MGIETGMPIARRQGSRQVQGQARSTSSSSKASDAHVAETSADADVYLAKNREPMEFLQKGGQQRQKSAALVASTRGSPASKKVNQQIAGDREVVSTEPSQSS